MTGNNGYNNQSPSTAGAVVGASAGILGGLLLYNSQSDLLRKKLRDQNATRAAVQQGSADAQRAVVGAAASSEGGLGLHQGLRSAENIQRQSARDIQSASLIDTQRQDAFDAEQRRRKEVRDASLAQGLSAAGALVGSSFNESPEAPPDQANIGQIAEASASPRVNQAAAMERLSASAANQAAIQQNRNADAFAQQVGVGAARQDIDRLMAQSAPQAQPAPATPQTQAATAAVTAAASPFNPIGAATAAATNPGVLGEALSPAQRLTPPRPAPTQAAPVAQAPPPIEAPGAKAALTVGLAPEDLKFLLDAGISDEEILEMSKGPIGKAQLDLLLLNTKRKAGALDTPTNIVNN